MTVHVHVLLSVWCVGAPPFMFYVGYRVGRFDERRQCLHGDADMRDPKVSVWWVDDGSCPTEAAPVTVRQTFPPVP